MKKRAAQMALAAGLAIAGSSHAQVILDMIAQRVVQNYQNASCEQLWQKKGQPPSPREQEVIQKLRSDPQLRAEFINKVAGPIVNRMFDCGLIP